MNVHLMNKPTADMSCNEKIRLVKEYYTEFQEQYYEDVARFDGMYYPPLWVCQTVADCKRFCLEHLPDRLAYRFIRQQRGRFGAFLREFEIREDEKVVDTEWWSDINLLPESDTQQSCSVCGELGTRIYFEKRNNFREQFDQLRQDVREWIEKNCDEKERERCLEYMEENWDDYTLFHGLPF